MSESEKKEEVISDFSTCRGPCQGIKVRKVDGSFDGRNKRYVDEHGRLWNGRVCPGCHKHKVKVKTKERRANSRNDSKN